MIQFLGPFDTNGVVILTITTRGLGQSALSTFWENARRGAVTIQQGASGLSRLGEVKGNGVENGGHSPGVL